MPTSPTPNPSVPANMTPAVVGGNKVPSTPSTAPSPIDSPDNTITDSTLRKVPVGVNKNWNAFINGQLTFVPAGTAANGVQSEPYVAYGDTKGDVRGTAVVLTGTEDGTGYVLKPIDQAVRDYINSIPQDEATMKYYKSQLGIYYPSTKALKLSMSQPITEPDDGFEQAVRKSLINLSRDNFKKGIATGNYLKDNPSLAKGFVSTLTTFDTFVNTRQKPPAQTSESIRNSSLTLREDAINDFNRTVQQYVGDPKLVDNLPVLAEAYWNKLHNEELKRVGISRSVTDPYTGNKTGSSIGYSQLTDVDRLEMRVGFITNGGSAKNKKGQVQQSNGIKGVDVKQLQDSGGLIGDNYTKLVNHSYEMGIPVNKDDLVKRSARTLLPGGSVDEQQKSMTQAAKVLYKGLSSYIDSGGKVSDIAYNFQNKKENELELVKGSVDIFDDYVQKALRSDTLPTDNDYIMSIRKDPNLGWKYTSKANEASAGFLDALLKTWGKVG